MKPQIRVVLIVLALASLACSLSNRIQNRATETPVEIFATAGEKEASRVPTQTPEATRSPTTASPTREPTQTPTFPEPTRTNSPTPETLATHQPTPTGVPENSQLYAVVLLRTGKLLQLRFAPGSNQTVLESLAPDTTGLVGTGRQSALGQETWIEVTSPDGITGWANAANLTRVVDPDTFCTDPTIKSLIANLKTAWKTQDGELLRTQVSPLHGLTLQYLREGTLANYNLDEAGWVFQSTYDMNWGNHPGSGNQVLATFSEEVLPKLVEVFDEHLEPTCNEIRTGGTTYEAAVPAPLQNFQYVTLHKPGSAGVELDWRTWLVGIEYIEDQPYLVSLVHLQWEP